MTQDTAALARPGNRCTRVLREAGKACPRTCAECGLGPCKYPAQLEAQAAPQRPRQIPDSECVQSKCACPTTGCWGECSMRRNPVLYAQPSSQTSAPVAGMGERVKPWHERTEAMSDGAIIAAMKAEIADLRAAHAAPAVEAQGKPTDEKSFAVEVTRGRVWIVKAHQSFMLAYEAETDAELQWYASQLRAILGAPTEPVTQAGSGDAEDAARYRWLTETKGLRFSPAGGLAIRDLAEMNEHIDAAMQQPVEGIAKQSTGMRCTICCAKAGEPHVLGCSEAPVPPIAVQNAMMALDAERARRWIERGPDRRQQQTEMVPNLRAGIDRRGR